MQKRVTGIGGIFFKSKDAAASREWYKQHLGFDGQPWGTQFEWRHLDEPEKKGSTIWSPFDSASKYMDPSEKDFMVNLRVENLEWLLEQLKNEGIEQIGEMQVHDYGKFAHILDPDGVKIELWEATEEAEEQQEQGE